MQYKPIPLHYKQKHITMKKQMKQIALPLFLGGLIACSPKTAVNETDLLGNWTEILPPSSNFVQGMTLAKEGKASSIGMATLQYESWQLLSDEQLVLSGKSIGNGQTIDFADTLDVVSLSGDTLTLGKGEMYRIQYVRQQEGEGLIGGSDAAMGYTWSKMLQKKIRVFEEGTRVHSVADPNSSVAGYLVFASDSSQVEFFYPETDVVLDRRTRPDGTPVWNVEDDDTYLVEKAESEWLVSRRGQLLYATSGVEDLVKAAFVADGGEEIEILFFGKAGVAQMNRNGVYSLLRQYRTASGYGYKNPVFDLRGKGQEAVLTTLSDGSRLALKEKK